MLASGDDPAGTIGKNLACAPGERLHFFPWPGLGKGKIRGAGWPLEDGAVDIAIKATQA
jgi:hypothetical protein